MRWFGRVCAAMVLALASAALGACGTTYTTHPRYGRSCQELADDINARVDCVTVFYGTNRVINAPAAQADGFSEVAAAAVTTEASSSLILGEAEVWLPRFTIAEEVRERGQEPRAREQTPPEEDWEHYVYVTRITRDGEQRFLSALSDALSPFGPAGNRHDTRRSILLFVHGFNVSFEEALIKTAQLSFDLQYPNQNIEYREEPTFHPGAPVLFAWPSRGETSVAAYEDDEVQAANADERLREFLELLLSEEDLDVERVNIVAHSMGNRVLTETLSEYARKYATRIAGRDIEFRMIVAAADVDRGAFDAAATAFSTLQPHVTIYTSNNDFAMFLSRAVARLFRGERRWPRLGDTNDDDPYIRANSNWSTIDTSSVASADVGFGHGYYANNQAVLNDARCALADVPEARRALDRAQSREGNTYWRTRAGDVADTSCILTMPTRTAQRGESEAEGPPPVAPPPPPPPPPPVMCPTHQVVVYFSGIELDAAALETIDAAIQRARACNIGAVRVVGHTDTVGEADANQRLSEQRANAVRDALIDRGVSADLISTEGRGETELARPTLDDVSEPLNRRVEVTITFR